MARNDNSYYDQRQRTYSGDNYYAASPPPPRKDYYDNNDSYYAASNLPPPRRDYTESYHSNQHRDSYNEDYHSGSNKQEVYEQEDDNYYHRSQAQQPYDSQPQHMYNSQPQQAYASNKHDMKQPQPPPQRYDSNPAAYDSSPSAYNDYRDQNEYDNRYAGASAADKTPYPVYDDYRSTTPISHAPSDYYHNSSSANLGARTNDPAYPAPLASPVNRSSGFAKRFSQKVDEDDAPEKPVKRSCLDYLCCGCCMCLPRWLRWICCFLLLIIIALAIAIAVLVATFKTPTVKYLGTSSSTDGIPQFTVNGTSWSIFTQLNIQVINPNVESITFSNVKAVVSFLNIIFIVLSLILQSLQYCNHCCYHIIIVIGVIFFFF